MERLFPDGARDPGLNLQIPYPYFFGTFSDSSNRILLFQAAAHDGLPTGDLIRFAPDGSRDWTFDIGLWRGMDTLVLPPDGRPVVVGQFTEVDGVPRNGIARLLEFSETTLRFAQPAHTVSEGSVEALLQSTPGWRFQ